MLKYEEIRDRLEKEMNNWYTCTDCDSLEIGKSKIDKINLLVSLSLEIGMIDHCDYVLSMRAIDECTKAFNRKLYNGADYKIINKIVL